MPKIAIFMNSLSGGGMERAMLNLANYFVKQGASVDLLVASTKGPLLVEIPNSVKLIDLKISNTHIQPIRWWLLRAALKIEPWFLLLVFVKKLPKAVKVIPNLVRYLEKYSPDVIMSTPTTANLALVWASSYCGYDKKTIIREASTLSEETKNKRTVFFRLMSRFVKKWYNHANTVICVSEGVYQDLENNFLVENSKLQTVYNILDIDKINNKSRCAEHDLQINSFGNYILSIGRLEKQKDYETLIRAFHIIAKDISVDLVILGEGSERLALENLISELSLRGRVHMPGFYINPYPFIKKCSVFALSSRWEGCPNVLREALVLNKNVISTDCPSGVREILSNGELGELVEVGNINQLAKALNDAINDKSDIDNTFADEMNKISIEQYKKLFFVSA